MKSSTRGTVRGITANLLEIRPEGPVLQNEICYIEAGDASLMGEVIKILGDTAYVQVFDSTRGLPAGAPVRFSGERIQVTLGPGMLGKRFDGLQNDLEKFEGIFLQRGLQSDPLDEDSRWAFRPLMRPGETVRSGDWLGEVEENALPLKIMAPFQLEGSYTLDTIAAAGTYGLRDTIATLTSPDGTTVPVNMVQNWPAKETLTNYREKHRPNKLLETGVRIFDTMYPMLEGGTGFIPGPFGCGKTVMQHALAKQADADVVIVAACGERANEVVEVFTEFPELTDARTGRPLIDRTIIIANTSSMPVAAREASVYTAMSIAEYYRSMGLRVLLLADSTSRWAQALREMANRLEDLPGPDAFPMDLSATIAQFYSRAGTVTLHNGKHGAVTFIGTVSPAGGNFKEPVTESTRKAARCFYALNQRRADSKRYPAVDPLESYSKYLDYPEFAESISESVGTDWIANAKELQNLLVRGKEAADQINILGDDGVSLENHIDFWRSELIDFVLLQQDAFDDVDQFTPLERQRKLSRTVLEICRMPLRFDQYAEVRPYFSRIINAMRQMNYAAWESEDYHHYHQELAQILAEKAAAVAH
jgi:V/A-type H+/Na+-transporting ATPase subunit A